MQNEEKQEELTAENQKQKTKRKKKGKVAEVYSLHQKGSSVRQIAEKMKLSPQVVRSYIWRSEKPQAYRNLLERYYEKKKKRKMPSTALAQPAQPKTLEKKSKAPEEKV